MTDQDSSLKLQHGEVRSVDTAQVAWRPSTAAPGVSVKDVAQTDGEWELQMVRFEPGARFPPHTHALPEFLFVLEGELLIGDERLTVGWASVSAAGSTHADVRSEKGCTFVLVDRVF